MRRREYLRLGGVIATVALTALCRAGSATDITIDAAVAAAPVLDDRYPAAKVMFGSDVESHPDLIYSTPPGFRPLRLDLYRQAGAAQPRPLVVYVHGGGWQSGHTRHAGAFENWPQVLASLARRGYVVASIEYRLSGEAKFPAAIHDVKNAIKWLRTNATKFAIDPRQVVIWGGSAGGQLAALAATSCGVQSLAPAAADSSPLATQSDCVQGLVAWYGVFDIGAMSEPSSRSGSADPAASPIGKYLGCLPAKCADTAALASAVTHLDAKDPPMLLIHGELDKVVPVGQSREFDQASKVERVASQLIVIPAVDHSFIGESPETTRKASLLALRKTFEFIDSLSGGNAQ
jgi:acetyl esterase/lipase